MKLPLRLHTLHDTVASAVLTCWHSSIAGLYGFVAVISNKGVITMARGLNEPMRVTIGEAVGNVTHLLKSLPSKSPLCLIFDLNTHTCKILTNMNNSNTD